MATTTPVDPRKKSTAPPEVAEPLVPPEEKFWERYSPNQEMPISGASSFVAHLLIIGLMVFMGVIASMLGFKNDNKIEVEAVRFNVGGGGGHRQGVGNAPGIGQPITGPNVETTEDKTQANTVEPERPTLDPKAAESAPIEVQKDPEFK